MTQYTLITTLPRWIIYLIDRVVILLAVITGCEVTFNTIRGADNEEVQNN